MCTTIATGTITTTAAASTAVTTIPTTDSNSNTTTMAATTAATTIVQCYMLCEVSTVRYMLHHHVSSSLQTSLAKEGPQEPRTTSLSPHRPWT